MNDEFKINVSEISKYNDIPIYYCTDCLSLKIQGIGDIGYCDKCGSTNIGEANIFDWEKLYESLYNVKYLKEKK